MKTLIIYKSIHQGNTEKVARRMAEVLGAELKQPDDFDVENIDDYDLVGLGSGIYDYKHHQGILNVADKLPRGKKVFIFSTSGIINKDQHSALRETLKKREVELIDEFFCKGFDKNDKTENTTFFERIMIYGLQLIGGINKGRPNEADLKKAEEFAGRLKLSNN